jgi:hypothetical protein
VEQDHYPRWGDIEHQQTDLELVVTVADALRLRDELPALTRFLADGEPRTPGEREHRREAGAALERLIEQLRDRLRPFGSPNTTTSEQRGG